MNEKKKHFILCILLVFVTGCLFAGLYSIGQRFTAARKFDQRYIEQHTRAGEIIAQLYSDLERERDINRQLHEHNNRARDIAIELTGTTERNVRDLQTAISLIGEIRAKIKVLADYYADWDSCSGGN
jgi:hypothetical protein